MKIKQRDRGAIAVEVVLLVPILVLVLGMIVAGWRVWAARQGVEAASQAAARSASLQSSGARAAEMAEIVASTNLETLRVPCISSATSVNVDDFALPAGTVGHVEVEVTCRVTFSDLLLPGTPGSMTVKARAIERLDTFAERQP